MSFASIADLPVIDDLDVPVSADEYVDQAAPAPLKPGNYRGIITKGELRKNKDGSLALQDGKYPTFTVQQIKLIAPDDVVDRLVGVFTDVRYKPFARKGKHGQDVPASERQDLLRSFDDSVNFEGDAHMNQLLQQYLEQNAPVLFQTRWVGFDKKYVDDQFALLGATTPEARKTVAKDTASQIYNKARLGTKNFVVNGVLQQSVVGPSGETVQAKVEVSRWFPSSTEIGKGKDAKGRERIELGAFKK